MLLQEVTRSRIYSSSCFSALHDKQAGFTQTINTINGIILITFIHQQERVKKKGLLILFVFYYCKKGRWVAFKKQLSFLWLQGQTEATETEGPSRKGLLKGPASLIKQSIEHDFTKVLVRSLNKNYFHEVRIKTRFIKKLSQGGLYSPKQMNIRRNSKQPLNFFPPPPNKFLHV